MRITMIGWAACVVLVGVSARPATAVTRCVKPGGGDGCFHLVQLAVDLSAPGDVVELRPGTYFENVYVEPRGVGIQIVGPASGPPAIVDASSVTDSGIIHNKPGFTVVGPNVQLRDITIHNGANDGVSIEAPGVRVERVAIVHPPRIGIHVVPGVPGARILNNRVSATETGIAVEGPGAFVDGNEVTGTEFGIVVQHTNGATVSNNRVMNGGERGIRVVGDDVVVRGNRIANYWGAGIVIDASGNPTVDKNVVTNTEVGVDLECTRCSAATITGNWAVDVRVVAFAVSAADPGLLVSTNTAQGAARTGFLIDGSDIRVENNRTFDSGLDHNHRDQAYPCFRIRGDRNDVRRNAATHCAATGFELSGAGLNVTLNEVHDSFSAGFRVQGGGAQLVGNKAVNTTREGFRNDATAVGSSFVANTASGNWVGFCDQGQGTTQSRNAFETVGSCM
jgi:parallel beta-helix repeat protein